MDLLNVVIRADTGGADRSTAALDKMTAGARQADAAIASLGSRSAGGMGKVAQAADLAAAANQRLAASTKGASISTANLAAQFQDIAVTSAMGMSPLQIALQQGTQISAAFGDKGAAGALQAMGAAFMSVISPVSLATIGFVALAAAGLQMVDWTGVAKGALQGVAAGLEIIAPYAAGAAAALTIIYSPAIVAGLVSVVAYLGSIAAAAMTTAASFIAAWIAAASPLTLIVASLAIVVTAVLLFRDQISKVLGFDLVSAAQGGINAIIGFFVGGFNAIGAVWGNLGAVFQELMWNVGQEIALGFQNIVRNAASSINDLINLVPEQFRMGLAPINVEAIKFTSSEKNPSAGAGANVGAIIAKEFGDAQGVNYVGAGIEFVQNAASGAADALRDLAGGLGKAKDESSKAAKEAAKQAEAYADLTRGAREFIEAEQLKARSLGMTEEAASRLKFAQDMMNKAANDNINLTASQRQEIDMLATAMASAQEATREITEIYNFGKGVFGSFFSDLKTGLTEGKGLWGSFASAASNALDTIANKLMEKATNSLWDMLFNSVLSGFGGGNFMGGTVGAPALKLGFQTGIPGFAVGTNYAPGGLAWVGEKGPELINLPRGSKVFPTGQSMSMAANQNQANDNPRGDLHVHINGSGMSEEQLGRAIASGIRDYDASLAPKVEAKFRTMQNDPRAADGGW